MTLPNSYTKEIITKFEINIYTAVRYWLRRTWLLIYSHIKTAKQQTIIYAALW